GTLTAKKTGLGIAIDLGTTTIAAQIVDLASGNVLGVETLLNPQAAFGSDVMSRIRAALDGNDLTTCVRAALGKLVARLAAGRQAQVAEVILVGNTVMHHLFSGLDVEPLAHVPFQSPHLGEQQFTPRDLAWDLPADCTIRFARCIGGFVGSDILAGIIATGIANGAGLSALIDLGTNGEIAIGNRLGVACASTAAGPAFEAGAIRMGMRAVTGAIAYVSLDHGTLRATVIGDASPRGICGSGVVDAVAAGLRSGAILSNGRVANGTKLFPVMPPVVLYQADIRELQLAKAAIAAGFRLLLKRLAARVRDLQSIHLAGAFGNYVQIESAIEIGLIEAPRPFIHAAGNTALRGAKMLLLTAEEPPLPPIEHVSLAADLAFQDEFANCMSFPRA
ncbi:MAG: ASKHA domain-containing protein, partial [Xanthobacteraceae bacterium]|nr:ASKHA domain-containing protein [Xanthobacteraceae bacterium]